MTKETNQKKIGPLRRAFNYAGAVFLAVYFGGPQMAAHYGDVTDDLAQKLDVPTTAIRAMTRGPSYILHPDSDTAVIFSYLNESPQLRGEILAQNTPEAKDSEFYDFFGIAYAHPLFGPGGYLNKMTFGQSGQLSPCYVLYPSDRLSMDTYYEIIGTIPGKDLVNRPGTWNDYLKLILFHELAHCDQPVDMPRDRREFLADQAAYDAYLAQGGNRDVVRAALSLRTLVAMSNIMFYGDALSEEKAHSNIALLYPRYFGGPIISDVDFLQVQNEIYTALNTIGAARGMDGIDLIAQGNVFTLTKSMLHDESLPLSPQTRAFIKQFNDAYEFLTTVPEQKVAAKSALVPMVR